MVLVQPVCDYTLKEVTFYSLLFAAPSVFLLAFNSMVPEQASRPSSSPQAALFIGQMLGEAPRKG